MYVLVERQVGTAHVLVVRQRQSFQSLAAETVAQEYARLESHAVGYARAMDEVPGRGRNRI